MLRTLTAFRGRKCGPTLEAAFARLDAAGIKYDRAEIAATMRCPICGCSIIAGSDALDRVRRDPPAF